MGARRIAVLLPPSKGKTADDSALSGSKYSETLRGQHPLVHARRTVLDALLTDQGTLQPAAKMRLYGVGESGLSAAEEQHQHLGDAPTRPARDRYHGVVYTNAELPNRACDHPDVSVYIVSALLGLAELDTPVPNYRLEFGARLPSIGTLARFWSEACQEYLLQELAEVETWNLLPNEHRGILGGCAEQLNLIDVRFVSPSGARANTARIKVAKGQIVATLRREGPLTIEAFAALDPLAPGWTFSVTDNTLIGVCHL